MSQELTWHVKINHADHIKVVVIGGFQSLLKFTTILDDNHLRGFPALGSNRFNLVNNIKAIRNLSKHAMLSVQPRSVNGTNEELGAAVML
jgi:hypothetical protein